MLSFLVLVSLGVQILKKHLILPAWSEKDYDFADACQALRDYCRLVAAPGADSSCLLSR